MRSMVGSLARLRKSTVRLRFQARCRFAVSFSDDVNYGDTFQGTDSSNDLKRVPQRTRRRVYSMALQNTLSIVPLCPDTSLAQSQTRGILNPYRLDAARALHGARLLEVVAEEARRLHVDAHGAEDDGEVLLVRVLRVLELDQRRLSACSGQEEQLETRDAHVHWASPRRLCRVSIRLDRRLRTRFAHSLDAGCAQICAATSLCGKLRACRPSRVSSGDTRVKKPFKSRPKSHSASRLSGGRGFAEKEKEFAERTDELLGGGGLLRARLSLGENTLFVGAV